MSEVDAYHEAGHAFMAVVLGGDVPLVTIDPDWDDGPKRYGETQILWREPAVSAAEQTQRDVLVSLAGPVAEMIYTGDPFHPAHVAEWSMDWRQAWHAAREHIPHERKRLTFLEQMTLELYRRFRREADWAAIADLADHLLAHETLEAEVTRDLVENWLG